MQGALTPDIGVYKWCETSTLISNVRRTVKLATTCCRARSGGGQGAPASVHYLRIVQIDEVLRLNRVASQRLEELFKVFLLLARKV